MKKVGAGYFVRRVIPAQYAQKDESRGLINEKATYKRWPFCLTPSLFLTDDEIF